MHLTEYCNERIEAQLSRLAPVSKARKAVAGVKGAAAEGGKLQPPPGHPENIRLTVAFAESYGLIAVFPRAFWGVFRGFWKDRQPMQMALHRLFSYQ